jgi:hypothetical protein
MSRRRIKKYLKASGQGCPTGRSVFPVYVAMVLQILTTAAHGGPTTARPAIHPTRSRAVVYTGEVNAKTAWRFLNMIAGHERKNVSLDVVVKADAPGELEKFGYYAGCDGRQLAISIRKPPVDGGGFEVVRNGRCKSGGGRFPIIGAFFVSGGGFTQGISSFGLDAPRHARARTAGRQAKIRVRF